MGSSSGKEECEDMSQQESESESRKRKRSPQSENAGTVIIEAVQQVAGNKAVWRANTNGGYQDVMYSIYTVLTALFTNQIVPYPSNPYEEYTLSNCVVFTMTLSKALRKTHAEMEHVCEAGLVTNALGKNVLCYGDWVTCPYHMAHGQVPDDLLKWKSNGVSEEGSRFISGYSRFGDLAVLNSLFPEGLCNEESPSDLQSSIDTLRTECLCEACYGGEKSLVKRLITLGTDINRADRYGGTPLWWACVHGHVEIVNILKDIPGIDVNKADQRGQTPFCVACNWGLLEIAKILKDIPGIDVNKSDIHGKTPLWCACNMDRVDIVTILKDIPDIDINKATSLMWAFGLDNLEIQKVLEDITKYITTPFCGACYWGHVEIVKILKDVPGIDVNKGGHGRTPFYCACERGHLEIVMILKDIPGIDINKGDVSRAIERLSNEPRKSSYLKSLLKGKANLLD